MGRVLLAGLSEVELAAYLDTLALRALTPATVTDKQRLRRELERARRQRWALVDQELEDGLRSVAAPLRDSGGRVVAAINLSTHASRRSPAAIRQDLLPPLIETATAIERDLTAGGVQ
jgi:IclR family pca regulon transcriptional regulator